MEQKKTESDVTYWHPAFYADIQIELQEDADNLEFESEHQLGTNPMEIDVLIIKKETDQPIKKNIGKIFRKYNIIEYKSPDDFLSIDDFYKVYGYACFYKADAPLVDSIPIQELTITFIAEKYPRKLIRHLQKIKNYTVKKTEPGIYQVSGDFIPIQIIITKTLTRQKNLWLKSLTNKLQEPDHAKKLIDDYLHHSQNNLYRSVLETIIRANPHIFKEVNEMGDIFMEICQEKFDRKLKEAVDQEVEKATRNLMENFQKSITESVTKEVTESVTKEVTESVTKEVTESVTKEVTENVTKEVTESVTKEVTESVTKEVTKKTKLMERISLIQKKCRKHKPLSVIANELETDPDELCPVYNIVFENTEKTVEELYELLTRGAVC